MKPFFQMFGKTYSSYGILGLIGFIISVVIIYLLSKRNKEVFSDSFYIFILGLLGLFLGSKVLYILTVLPGFINDLKYLAIDRSVFLQNISLAVWFFMVGYLVV